MDGSAWALFYSHGQNAAQNQKWIDFSIHAVRALRGFAKHASKKISVMSTTFAGSISVEGLYRSSVLPRQVRLSFRLEGDRLAIGNKRWPVDFPVRDHRPILFNR
jgi:hypothetical protein